jgi:hypothetical protein
VQALLHQASLRATLEKLRPVEIGVEPRVVMSLNTPEDLAQWT